MLERLSVDGCHLSPDLSVDEALLSETMPDNEGGANSDSADE
jgi:hypothetical protein